MSYLNLQEISRSFGDFVAVDRFNLKVDKGEFVSLLGPSGCGKTTTLQMIAGFLEPSHGQIMVGGENLTTRPANQRNIGIVFQSYALFPHLTAAQNVAFGLEMRKVSQSERQEKIDRALDLVHLGAFRDRYPKQLSGGQQQRVALARAIVIEPKILLLDEPMSNLDAKLREDMQLELRSIQEKLGITTILVTHDQNEAMALSDRIAVMNEGRIVQVGKPHEIYEDPANVFVSSFLGKNNLLTVEIEEISGPKASVRFNGQSLTVPCREGITNEDTWLSIRPEKVQLTEKGNGLLAGKIKTRVFFGNHWLFQIETTSGEFLVYSQNTAVPKITPRDEVGLSWQAEDARLLSLDAS